MQFQSHDHFQHDHYCYYIYYWYLLVLSFDVNYYSIPERS